MDRDINQEFELEIDIQDLNHVTDRLKAYLQLISEYEDKQSDQSTK